MCIQTRCGVAGNTTAALTVLLHAYLRHPAVPVSTRQLLSLCHAPQLLQVFRRVAITLARAMFMAADAGWGQKTAAFT